MVAETDGALAGFVTVDPKTGYLDQIVVAPEAWGGSGRRRSLDEAKRLSPARLDLHVNKDNARAIRFYEKHGFAHRRRRRQSGVGGRSRMSWPAEAHATIGAVTAPGCLARLRRRSRSARSLSPVLARRAA